MLLRRVAFHVFVSFSAALIVSAATDPSRLLAADPPVAPPKATPKPRLPRPPLLPSSLIGRITDEQGAPVADARLEIYPKRGGAGSFAKTKADGSYAFDRVPSAAVYQLRIYSTRCVSLTDYQDENLTIPLDPPQTVTRNFVLKPACQLQLTIVDEHDRPIPKVRVFESGPYDGQLLQTDKEGKLTIGGLAPSPLVSRFALYHDDYVVESLAVKLDDPKVIVERKITLSEGKSVRGTVTCSDGKPPSRCHVLALPSWWNSMLSPNPRPIQPDGSFVIPHVGPGTYKIAVYVPQGPRGTASRDVMSDVELFDREEPLAIRVDFPSTAATEFIEGKIRFKGGLRPKQGFWIQANAAGAPPLAGGQYIVSNQDTFKVGPLPPGRYVLTTTSPEMDSQQHGTFAAGTRNVELELSVRGPMTLKGLVVGDQDGELLKNLLIRLRKTRSLRGPNYNPDRNWQHVADPRGAFAAEIPGPGVYVVEASAEGYALSKSDPVNSDTDLKQELRIKLSRGVSVSGMVVDEAGRPINGATVLARSQFGSVMPVSAAKLPAKSGMATIDGGFRFEHLSPGKETIRALHPDYVFAEARDLELKMGAPQAPITLTMKRGCTVRGRVYDELGRPSAGVPLEIRSGPYSDFEATGEFASSVSDEAGEYEAAHLPETLIYISRGNIWSSLGVVRQTVLPAAGKTVQVDFGGVKKVTGRLVVNGAPVANTKVLLSGENSQGEMMAYTLTNADGNFVFRGIPPGERCLYYSQGTEFRQNWVRVKPLRIETSNDSFGAIHVVTGTLAIHSPEADPNAPAITTVWLSAYDPVWFNSATTFFAAPRQDKNDPFLFPDLAIGKYAVTLNRPQRLGVMQAIEIAGPGRKTVTLEAPKGTASLQGKVEDHVSDANRYVQLQSKDKRLFAILDLKPDGSFGIDELPAGDYFLTPQALAGTDPLMTISVANGEKKSISLPSLAKPGRPRNGFLEVSSYTVDGLPLPGCEIILTGTKGAIRRQARSAQVSFATDPGPYQVSASYPGFAPVTKQVDVKVTKNGRLGPDNQLNVTLVRVTEPTKAEAR
jgi:hypothetical protein